MTVDHKAQTFFHKVVIKIIKSFFQSKDTFTACLLRKRNHILYDIFFTEVVGLKTAGNNTPDSQNFVERRAYEQSHVRTTDGNEH